MIWLSIALLALAACTPLVWPLLRRAPVRGRRDAAMALHRAQLTELDRDLADGRLLPAEHEAARLEVQRRLLAEADQAEAATRAGDWKPLAAVLALVPAAAVGLYLVDGKPYGPSPDQLAQAGTAEEDVMVTKLRQILAPMDPKSPKAREGFVLLGKAEVARGHIPEAADAWRHALEAGFDPTLAAETAEAISEAEGHITPEAMALFKRALAEAPADVNWRKMVEKKLAEARGS